MFALQWKYTEKMNFKRKKIATRRIGTCEFMTGQNKNSPSASFNLALDSHKYVEYQFEVLIFRCIYEFRNWMEKSTGRPHQFSATCNIERYSLILFSCMNWRKNIENHMILAYRQQQRRTHSHTHSDTLTHTAKRIWYKNGFDWSAFSMDHNLEFYVFRRAKNICSNNNELKFVYHTLFFHLNQWINYLFYLNFAYSFLF